MGGFRQTWRSVESLGAMQHELDQFGHSVILPTPEARASPEASLIEVAEMLGTPQGMRSGTRLVEHLRPQDHAQAKPRSLSARYGTHSFPWHSDGAFWPTPPRYLVLGCVSSTEASARTEVVQASNLDIFKSESAMTSLFAIRNGRKSFYATVASQSYSYVRHDPGCMEPLNKEGKKLQCNIERSAEDHYTCLIWESGMIVVVDNWKCLHRRSRVHDSERDTRHLIRIAVMDTL
jgi:alpha-ketoglutarate-dependent taurine dioxygenase